MLSLGLHAACRREHRRSSHTFSLQTLEWKQHAFSGLFCQTGIQHNVSAKAAQRVNQLAVTDIVNISVTHSVAALDSFFFSFFTLCFYFRLTKSRCKMYRKAFAVSTKGTDVLWSAISKCYYSRAALFPRVISNPAGLTCVVLFFCPNHVTVLNIAVCACTLKLWNLESFPGRFVVSVTTSIRCDSGKLMLLARSASGLYFIFKRVILFQSISSLLCLIVRVTVVDRLKTTTFPSFADNPHTLKKTTHHLFQIPGLSTVHRHIYFLKRKKNKTVYDLRWRGENIETDPASLRGVSGIYSVYFLHAVHINPHRCRYTARIMSHSASVFQGKHLSHSF